jgi:hypothetical protein
MVASGSLREAYGFVGNAGSDPAGFVREVREISGVRFAARTFGAYDVFLAAEAPSLRALQNDVAGAVKRAGARHVRWSLVVGPQALHPKRFVTAISAFVRVSSPDPVALLEGLVEGFAPLNDRDGFGFGAAVVTGEGYDLLVELGAPSEDDAIDLVFGLRGADGVGGTETTFASFEGDVFQEGS